MCCKQNIGSLDRAIRLVIGVILFLLSYYVMGDSWQIAGYIISIVLLATGLKGYCGLYALLGTNTLDETEE